MFTAECEGSGYEKEPDSTAPILLCLIFFVSDMYGSLICYVKICVGLLAR